MKYYIVVIAACISLFACSSKVKSTDEIIANGSLIDLKTRKKSLSDSIQFLEKEMAKIENAISKKDTISYKPQVTIDTIKTSSFAHYVTFQGSVETKQNLILKPEFGGILKKIYVKEGEKVSKGKLLASIDDGGLSQQLAQLEIQLALAKTTFERQERLWEERIGSEMQFLQAKSNYEAQSKAKEQLKKQLAKTKIIAPFSGTIDEIITEEGNVVAPGQSPILRIINLNKMEVSTEIPETYISSVAKGKKVKISIPIINFEEETTIRQVGSYINPINRTFKVEVPIPNKKGLVKPNLTATININDYTNPEAILINQNLLSENAEGQQYVYLVSKNDKKELIASQTVVTTGKTQGDKIEILSGVKKEDCIIVSGARSIRDKQEISIKF